MSANPLKRRSNNESPPRRVASKVASRESAWDKTTYRISNIPTTFDVPHLADTVADVLELESSSDVKIGSLCLDAVDQGDPQHKVATASFRVRPALLSSKSEGVDDTSAKPLAEWQFSLPHVEDGEIHFDIHFHGFTPLSPVEMQERRTIEFVQLKYFYSVGAKPSSCVAIHGWGGHAFGSYRATGASYMWLRDSLPKHFPKLRVWIYGYESNLSDSHSTSNVYEDAENFRRALRILRRKIGANDRKEPMISISHSLGGLIFKEAMIRMKDSEIQDDQLNFQLTYGALFFGVPGQGMDVENLATMVHNLPARYNLSLLDQQMGFRLRNRQHEDFCRAYDYRDSKIVQFFELKKSPTFRKDDPSNSWKNDGPYALLVNPASAVCGRNWEGGDEYVVSINKDHQGMVKFAKNDRDGYEKVRDILEGFTREAQDVIDDRMSREMSSENSPKSQSFSEEERRCLQSLFFTEMYYRQHDISPPADDTCEWIWDHPIYLEWSHQRRGLLWIKGKPGAGKSKLVRHISKKMEEHKERNVILASHFFHGRGDVIQRNHLGLFRSLLHQLLQKDPELLQAFSSTYKMKSESCGEYGKKWTWETGELRHIFTHYLSKIAQRRPVCIFIDALDECGEDAAIELVELFYELMTKSNSAQSRPSICFSCRHFPVLAVEGGLEICVEAENHVDLSAYIQTQLQNMVPNPDTASHLSSEILDRSQGNFQWTCLCIRQVVLLYKRGKSRRALEKSIRDMPSQLDDLYTGLLRYDNNADRNQALRLMRWIHFALRPLTVDELRWALLVSGDHTCESLKRYQEVEDFAETEDQMERRMVDLSRGLAEVTIHNGEHKAQFIHQSVDDFFVEKGFQLLSDTGCDNVAGVAHVQLSLSCLRYMAVEEITSHLATIDSGLREEFPLLRYASQCWHLHAQRAEEIECSLTELSSFLREPSLDALQTWYELRAYFEFRIRTPYRGKMNTLLHAVANYNLRSILPFILGSNDVDINARDLMDETPLIVAAGKGHDSIVRLLLDRDDVRVDHINSNFETALLKAARKGHRAVVRLLLKRIDLDVNLSDVDKLTDRPESSPLLSAISNQRMAIVSQLLARKEVDVNCVNRLGETPLTLALRRVDEDLMRLLLSHPKIDVNARDGYRDTPLTLATTLARTEVVQLLLSHPNIDVNARAGYRDTPLTLATTLARTEVVPLLLSHLKIDVNARDWYDATPLTSATYFGRTEIVRLLLSHPKIDVNARTTHDATPLILATRYDETEVVQLLLSHPKIDVNARDRYGDTPLTLATADRWNEAVRLLLSHPKIDVNARDMNGDTPLSLARKGGREAILELLLRRNDIVVDD